MAQQQNAAFKQLADGVRMLGLRFEEAALDAMLDYIHLLQRWNKTYNLTAIESFDQMIAKHLLDSLAIAPYIGGNTLLDLGTGAGLPGIPIAIAMPELKTTLLDGRGKKIRFVDEAVRHLNLSNVDTVKCRAEQYRPTAKFDNITSRAFSDLHTFTRLARDFMTPMGSMLAMKGTYPAKELKALADIPEYKVTTEILSVPDVPAARHLVIIRSSFRDSIRGSAAT